MEISRPVLLPWVRVKVLPLLCKSWQVCNIAYKCLMVLVNQSTMTAILEKYKLRWGYWPQTDIFYLRKESYVKGCILMGALLVKNKPRQLRERERENDDMLHKSQTPQAILELWWQTQIMHLFSLGQETTNYLTIQNQKVMQLSSKPQKQKQKS